MVAMPRRRGIRLLPRAVVPLLLAASSLMLVGPPAAAADVTAGLVLRYDLSQTSGTTVADTSGNGRDGTLNGDASWSGGGLALGGTNGYVKLPNNVMAGLTQITVSADVYIDAAQSTPYMIWAMGNTTSAGVGNGYLFATGNAYRTSIATGNWTTEQTATSTAALTRGVWASISYTLDAAGVATEYLNGESVATKTGVTITPGAIGDGTTTANYLGRSVYTADKYVNGMVKNFRIYDRALTATETAQIAIPDATRVAGDKAGLTLGDTTAVTADLSLPGTGPAYGSKVTWSSAKPA
ncbi:MAG TPA: LamG domain-containing protein, partial [Kineosporiaceae bacterium]|nr:LamG domain-containing protein [Kineosporiaceae bacterium]